MLYISTESGAACSWNIDSPVILPDWMENEIPQIAKLTTEVQADGDELEEIHKYYRTSGGKRVQTFFGDKAKEIVANIVTFKKVPYRN